MERVGLEAERGLPRRDLRGRDGGVATGGRVAADVEDVAGTGRKRVLLGVVVGREAVDGLGVEGEAGAAQGVVSA